MKNDIKTTVNAEEIFSEIYRKKLWGGDGRDFYSGRGSEHFNTEIYRKYLQDFIRQRNITSVVDVGCGDFQLGSLINWQNVEYTGIDVVGELIKKNNEFYSTKNIKFIRRDVLCDNLPSADLCLMRQVLQHFCNEDIRKVLPKLQKYKYVLITDGLPVSTPRVKNVDKPTDHHNRCFHRYRSGLYLEAPPFNLEGQVVLNYTDRSKTENFRTILVDRSLSD